jgi:hypothetical protein
MMADVEEQTQTKAGGHLVTVLYSRHRDVYRLPTLGFDLWLSVEVHTCVSVPPNLGETVATSADGKGYRRAHRGWWMIEPGQSATLPEDDPLVVDYIAAVKEK